MELWLRPWALVVAHRRLPLASGERSIPPGHRTSAWIYVENELPACTDTLRAAEGFREPGKARSLFLAPFPLRRSPGLGFATADGTVRIVWPDALERPSPKVDPTTDEEKRAHALLLRAEAVWDRLSDVETALADPARLWEELRRRWTTTDDMAEPSMNVIVRHARELSRTLEELDLRLRRILRRTHQHIPVSRVQEMDRRAMQWLARQPGETLAERAGDTQRILAVAREENFDTLENRVLRAYAELARKRARDYLDRNQTRRLTRRAREVEAFGSRCKRLARDLVERGVRLAEPGVTPNFVLQQNPHYHSVWVAWVKLLKEERILDELWRWQARSWEEFCALCIMVALQRVPGARLIASSPIVFRDEQVQGSWITHDNPLGVFHLPRERLVIEVQYGFVPGQGLSDFAAPIWVKYGHVGNTKDFLKRVAVWPIWDTAGGLVEGELSEISELIPMGRRANFAGGIVLRPAVRPDRSERDALGSVLAATLGTEGAALSDALETIAQYFMNLIPSGRR